MKKIFLIFVVLSAFAFGQFKDPAFPEATVKDGIINSNSSSLFGFLNSDDFSMRHTYNLSYSSFAGEGLALGMYTNSMFYRFSNNLNVQLDASIVHSPYSTLGNDFQKNISGLYISRAAVNFQPWKDVSVSLMYRNLPYNYYNYYNYYSPFRSFNGGFFENHFGDENPFERQ